MIRAVLLMLSMVTASVYAAILPGSECAAPGRFIEQGLFSAFTKDLLIARSSVNRNKTTVEVLSITPVSDVFARQLAKTDTAAGNGLSEDD